MKLPKLILASGSPRRAEILTSVGWSFEKDSADIDETEFPGEKPEDYVVRLALGKAAAVAEKYTDGVILGADTTVVIDGLILAKPVDLDDAKSMIRRLSGRRHEVLTGVALVARRGGESRTISGLQRTGVTFKNLTEAEIDFLVEQGEPLDKAGGYAVQNEAALFISGIEGDYWNVVGLPISLVYALSNELLLDL